MAQGVKSPLASHTRVWVQVPADALEQPAEDARRAGAPATHAGDRDGAPGSWFQPGPAPALVAILEVPSDCKISVTSLSLPSGKINQK